jgi:hypothetical protein
MSSTVLPLHMAVCAAVVECVLQLLYRFIWSHDVVAKVLKNTKSVRCSRYLPFFASHPAFVQMAGIVIEPSSAFDRLRRVAVASAF